MSDVKIDYFILQILMRIAGTFAKTVNLALALQKQVN